MTNCSPSMIDLFLVLPKDSNNLSLGNAQLPKLRCPRMFHFPIPAQSSLHLLYLFLAQVKLSSSHQLNIWIGCFVITSSLQHILWTVYFVIFLIFDVYCFSISWFATCVLSFCLILALFSMAAAISNEEFSSDSYDTDGGE